MTGWPGKWASRITMPLSPKPKTIRSGPCLGGGLVHRLRGGSGFFPAVNSRGEATDPNYLGRFVSMLGHEGGHAVIQDRSRISPRAFARIAAFIEGHAGIKMPESKRLLVEGRLLRNVNASPFGSIDEYCDHVLSGDASELKHHLPQLCRHDRCEGHHLRSKWVWLSKKLFQP